MPKDASTEGGHAVVHGRDMKPWVRYHGPFEELKQLIKLARIPGDWRELDEGDHQFYTTIGAYLNWWPSTGTVTFQGRSSAVQQLREALDAGIGQLGVAFDEGWITRRG